MNLINYDQVMEALDKERQLLLNREQYGAENVLVHHAINVIAELPIVKQPEIIRCKDCKYFNAHAIEVHGLDRGECDRGIADFVLPDWFCADGERR